METDRRAKILPAPAQQVRERGQAAKKGKTVINILKLKFPPVYCQIREVQITPARKIQRSEDLPRCAWLGDVVRRVYYLDHDVQTAEKSNLSAEITLNSRIHLNLLSFSLSFPPHLSCFAGFLKVHFSHLIISLRGAIAILVFHFAIRRQLSDPTRFRSRSFGLLFLSLHIDPHLVLYLTRSRPRVCLCSQLHPALYQSERLNFSRQFF